MNLSRLALDEADLSRRSLGEGGAMAEHC